MSKFKTSRKVLLLVVMLVGVIPVRGADRPLDYRILATSKTSTMERELNEASAAGYRFSQAMGGKTANGGQEVVVAMVREPVAPGRAVRRYKLLATSRTSSMQKEIQQAADEGYEFLEQTVFESAFGGREVAVIMELDPSRPVRHVSYRVLATSRTSTMQKELREFGAQGYSLLGLTVGETAFGGDEIVATLKKD